MSYPYIISLGVHVYDMCNSCSQADINTHHDVFMSCMSFTSKSAFAGVCITTTTYVRRGGGVRAVH